MLGAYKKKRGKYVLFYLVIAFFVGGFVFFWNDSKKERNAEEFPLSFMLNKTSIDLNEKDSHPIFVIINERDGSKVNVTKHSTFSTSNTSVANVNDAGLITAADPGTANITVRYKEFTENIAVTVPAEVTKVNVKDYGAVGDGVADDTRAFQHAIDDLSKRGGGEVFIPEGTYALHPIFLKPKTSLIGENRDTVTLKYADDARDGYHRLINMNDHTKVKNFTCDGNYRNHPNGTEHMHCIFAYDKEYLFIDNNRLMNAVGDGISISGSAKSSHYVTISNNIVEENQRSQIVIEQVNHLQIFNNTIMSETGRPGIHFEPWEEIQQYDAQITGNTIITNSEQYCGLLAGADSELAGIGSSGYLYHGIEFYQNYVDCPSGALLIKDTAGIKVYDNTLNVGEIKIWRKNENVNIYNNRITGEMGIRIEGGWNGNLVSSGTKIYDNTFNTSGKGVSIHDGARKPIFTDNVFTGSGKDLGVELFVTEDIRDITLSNNTFSHYEMGVYIDYYSNPKISIKEVTLRNNTFKDLKEYAFYPQGPVHNAVMDHNRVINASGDYIDVHEGYSMSHINITNNRISHGENGIIQNNYGNGLLDGLTISGNHISHTTNKGYAAIELNQRTKPPANVSISGNVLTDNVRNFIVIPHSIRKFVDHNEY